MRDNGTVLLTLDVEEFDMPLEYGQAVPEKEQLKTGYEGFLVTMSIIDRFNVPVTLFTTANFADHFPADIRSAARRHEIASHTYYHSQFENSDLLKSKKRLEEIAGREVKGLRMPRMRPVEMFAVKAAGYAYDSSINPTWIPGRYNNLHLPRTTYIQEGMLRVPASVSPRLRVPLFWLSFKNFPYHWFLHWVRKTVRKDGYVCLYFHPWEFVDLSAYQIPAYTKRLAGDGLQKRLQRLIADLKTEHEFSTVEHFLLK